MNDDERFTNRHGRTITALKEAVNTLPEPEYVTAARKPARRVKRRQFRLSRRQGQVLLVILVAIILIPVGVGEYVRGAYAANVSSAKNSIAQLFDSVVISQKSAVTSKTLSDADTQLSSIRDGLCPGGFLDNLAKLYPRAQGAYDDCASYRSKVTALESIVSSSAAQMSYLEQLQPLLAGVSKPLEDQFAILSAQQENWQSFVDSLNQLSVPASLSSAHASLVKEASNIKDQWIALVQATNSQNSASFREARTQLTDSFTAFHGTAQSFTTAITSTQDSVNSAVAALK